MTILAVVATPAPQAVMTELTGLFTGGFPLLTRFIIYIVVGFFVVRLASVILVRLLGLTRLPKGLIKVAIRLLDAGLYFLLSIAILQSLGLTNVALALSGGFAVFALGLSQGLAATVGDMISGLNLARDRHFRIGDRVRVGSNDQKTEGIIVDMDMRKSRLKDKDGKIFVVPNSLIDKNTFELIERAGQDRQRQVSQRAVIRTRVAKAATIPAAMAKGSK